MARPPHVDIDECIGCEACVDICPDVFILNESLGKAMISNPEGSGEEEIAEAMEACPVNCIIWED